MTDFVVRPLRKTGTAEVSSSSQEEAYTLFSIPSLGLHLLTLCLPVMHDFIMLLATSEFFSYLNFVYSRKIAILNIKEYFKSYYECNECSDIGTKNRFMISIDEARCIPLNDVISLITFYD